MRDEGWTWDKEAAVRDWFKCFLRATRGTEGHGFVVDGKEFVIIQNAYDCHVLTVKNKVPTYIHALYR